MQEMGLAAIYPGPNLSKRAHEHLVFPYLLRHLTVTDPNHVWGIDTLAPERKRRCYLHPASRRLVVSGSSSRLVLALCAQLGAGPDARDALCSDRCAIGPADCSPAHLEQ